MKIFQLSDYEWGFAETLDEAYKAAEEETGVSRSEYEDDFTAIEIPESKWDTGKIGLGDEDHPTKTGTWREALELCTADGTKAGMLCGTES